MSGLKLAMVGAVLAVLLLALVDLRREQSRALEDFTAEESRLAETAAAIVGARVGAIERELRAAAATPDAASRERWLWSLAETERAYREIDIVDGGGRITAQVHARDTAPHAADDGLLTVSAQVAGGGSLVAIVDERRLLHELDGTRDANTPSRWLVLHRDDGSLTWDADAAPSLPRRLRAVDQAPEGVRELLARLGAGARSGVHLDRDAAESLGLPRRSAVAGLAPVAGLDGNWSVAVIASAMRERDRERVGMWRLAVATVVAALLSALFGLTITRQQRREQALAAELRLAAATASLRERSEKIVEAIPLGVLTLDATLRVRGANPFLVARGASAAEGGGTLAAALPDATAGEIAVLDELVARAHASRTPCDRPDVRLGLGGATREIDAYAVPLERPLPDADCFLVLHDRTEMRSLERKLVRADKLATIGTLTAGVAHEVGTPLGIISGRAEQLLARLPPASDGDAASDGPFRKGLVSILNQVEKVSTIIRQLLDFSRVRPIEGTAITPTQLLAGAGALLDHRFRHRNVTLTVDAPATVPAISGDPGQLEQVLVNLLLNAVDACATGGHVRARAEAAGTQVRIAVSDDGCGIPKENLGAVLDPFFTTKKRGQGTGLGLTIAADIVKNHGGTLDIESEVGRGTTVRITLPTADTTRSQAA